MIVPTVARSQTYKVLHNFTGGIDGANPASGRLIKDANGDLYGTAFAGGAFGCGVVFKIDPNGNERVLYSFTCGLDGDSPDAGLLLSGGQLYGTTSMGGEFVDFFGLGGEITFRTGALFKLDARGNETVVHSFGSGEGDFPHGDLVQDATGNFYGVTTSSGSGGYGTVFKVDSERNATVLYRFNSFDGAYPQSPVVLDATGNLYGTTPNGGDEDCDCGVIFKLDPTGHETILHVFGNGESNGGRPRSGLLRSQNGTLIGTATQGGTSLGGMIFALSPTGDWTVLYNFGVPPDGSLPMGGLILDSVGNLYGTTAVGGAFDSGTVFKLDPTRKETILHHFNGADGSSPVAMLLLDRAGNLYGTTESGGTFGQGVVFTITP
jgi:uncharacterized repeat protein (TIGR03803 family)